MATSYSQSAEPSPSDARPDLTSGVYPLAFSSQHCSGGAENYLRDPATRTLLEFFEVKGLAALKDEDRHETWYADWLAYQAQHGLYATVLAPQAYTTRGGCFDVLRYGRFLEVLAYCSPAHGYSVHTTFLGLFAVLMGSNEALKREAVARLDAGELLAFGVSEREHGSDLMANEFRIARHEGGQLIANGSKYYIGNANVASLIAVLGRMAQDGDEHPESRGGRASFMLIALRPQRSLGSWQERKIATSGVRAAHVGAFNVHDHLLSDDDVIAQGRQAWDAVLGTVTLGKFFLGFGAIGMCEHALHEAAVHVQERRLYGRPVFDMSHIRFLMAQAYGRLLAMKLYAYRTLDYVQAACASERRYHLFCAVQKAKVSTEGVKVMALLSECVGAKGFEGETYGEMALRDVALLPGLEGSRHINLGLAAQCLSRYFLRPSAALLEPPSLLAEEVVSGENPYLMSAPTGGTNTMAFAWFLDAYRSFIAIPNVALFVRQVAAFRRLVHQHEPQRPARSDTHMSLALGECLATIVYGQLVAEQARYLHLSPALLSVIFAWLVADLSAAALHLASIPSVDEPRRRLISPMIRVPRTSAAAWSLMAEQCRAWRHAYREAPPASHSQ